MYIQASILGQAQTKVKRLAITETFFNLHPGFIHLDDLFRLACQ